MRTRSRLLHSSLGCRFPSRSPSSLHDTVPPSPAVCSSTYKTQLLFTSKPNTAKDSNPTDETARVGCFPLQPPTAKSITFLFFLLLFFFSLPVLLLLLQQGQCLSDGSQLPCPILQPAPLQPMRRLLERLRELLVVCNSTSTTSSSRGFFDCCRQTEKSHRPQPNQNLVHTLSPPKKSKPKHEVVFVNKVFVNKINANCFFSRAYVRYHTPETKQNRLPNRAACC